MLYSDSRQIDYDKKINILIAVSGETRCFNTLTHRDLKFFKEKLQSLNYDVIIVGHTWKHCDPVQNQHLSLFDAIEVTDQKIIEDWVMEDFVTRCPNHDYNSFNITNTPIDIKSKESINKTLKLARYAWGQHWSAFASFKQFSKKKFKSRRNPGFDILIRWRWDEAFYIPGTYYKPGERRDKKLENTLFESFFNYLNSAIRMMNYEGARPFGATDGTGDITADNKPFFPLRFDVPILNDRFMIFNKQAAENLQIDFERILGDLLRFSSRQECYEGHTLWYTILFNLGISMTCDLPIFCNVAR